MKARLDFAKLAYAAARTHGDWIVGVVAFVGAFVAGPVKPAA
jgi:hypothetical protein